MKYCIIIAAFALTCYACNNIEDASPSNRNTFARFIESESPLEGVSAYALDDGYLILGRGANDTLQTSTLIKLDMQGKTLWKTNLAGVSAKSLCVGTDGYFVFGDSIKVDPEAEELVDLIIYSAILHKINFSGVPVSRYTLADYSTTRRTDFKSSAMTKDNQNNLILLGTYRVPLNNAPDRPFLISLDPVTYDTVWLRAYDIIDRDYVNAKSVHATADGHIVWATAILKEQQNFTRSYMAIPYIKEQSVFENNDAYGENTDQQLLIGDIKPAASPEFGYGVTGTYATPSGTDGNMFFAQVTKSGDIISGSERFFDGASQSILTELGNSTSNDTGDAICSTHDGGFVMAGSMVTTPSRGNGGKDILLVKVDGVGNLVWSKLFGGSGDEVVNSIIETSDGGLLLCGSKDAGGLPALFLIKTNSVGEIKD